MLKDISIKNRSYRKFDESFVIDEQTLTGLVEAARYTPSSVNMQPLKFLLSCDKKTNGLIFSLTNWAKRLPNYKGPAEGERPTAYIIICADKSIAPNVERFNMDIGIAAQTIMLAAVEKGLGGCMIGNYSKEDLSSALKLPGNIYPALILALGKPDEQIILEVAPNDNDVGYYRDENNKHHVPKRPLDKLIIHAGV